MPRYAVLRSFSKSSVGLAARPCLGACLGRLALGWRIRRMVPARPARRSIRAASHLGVRGDALLHDARPSPRGAGGGGGDRLVARAADADRPPEPARGTPAPGRRAAHPHPRARRPHRGSGFALGHPAAVLRRATGVEAADGALLEAGGAGSVRSTRPCAAREPRSRARVARATPGGAAAASVGPSGAAVAAGHPCGAACAPFRAGGPPVRCTFGAGAAGRTRRARVVRSATRPALERSAGAREAVDRGA